MFKDFIIYLLFICRYHEGRAFIIDVSQSVTKEHPHSLEFLRKDCTNITSTCFT